MRYTTELIEGKLIRRYKRFLADVIINNEKMTVHTPNSGSMAGLTDDGNKVRISGPHGKHRKYEYTLEQVQLTRPDKKMVWVGVNTMLTNHIAHEALKNRKIPALNKYRKIRSEVKISDKSRIDLLLENKDLPPCWVEVKNVTLVQSDVSSKSTINEGSIAAFPDAVTSRGSKHLHELINRVHQGERAAMIYIIQRNDCDSFSTAKAFDPEYDKNLRYAIQQGVEVYPIKVRVTKSGLWASENIPLAL